MSDTPTRAVRRQVTIGATPSPGPAAGPAGGARRRQSLFPDPVGRHSASPRRMVNNVRHLRKLVSVSRIRAAMRRDEDRKYTTGPVVGSGSTPTLRRLQERRDTVDLGPDEWPTLQDLSTHAEDPSVGAASGTDIVDVLVGARDGTDVAHTDAMLAYTSGSRRGTQQTEGSDDTLGESTVSRLSRLESITFHKPRLLPLEAQLQDYPEEMRAHLERCALAVFRRLLAPLLVKRIRLGLSGRPRTTTEPPPFKATRVPLEHLQRLQLLQNWPIEGVKAVSAALKPRLVEARAIVVHEREPTRVMLLVGSGAVTVKRRADRSRKNGSGNVEVVQATVPAPAVFGELSLLTQEPWAVSIVTATRCDLWTLEKADFDAVLQTLPDTVMHQTRRLGLVRRADNLPVTQPFGADDVRGHTLFNGVSRAFAEDLVRRLDPYAAPENETLATESAPATALFFLRRGVVHKFREVSGGDRTQVGSLPAPCMLADAAVAHGAAYDSTLITGDDCDLYSLSKASFDALLKQHPLDQQVINHAMAQRRHDEVQQNLLRFRSIVQQVPLLKGLPLSSDDVKSFLARMVTRTYPSMASVCSTSTFCDRIIFVTRGRLCMGGPGRRETLGPGDCTGWTCTVPHRWSRGLMTMQTTVDIFELPVAAYVDFLEERGWLRHIVRQTKTLLFPCAFDEDDVRALQASLPPHHIMYPISKSARVNLNEMQFCTVHISEQKKEREVERRREQMIKSLQPPPYRPLAGGFWVPKACGKLGFTTRR